MQMQPVDPHEKSRRIRRFRSYRKPAGIFGMAVAFCDASLTVLAFFLSVSPFVLQPGIHIQLPSTRFVSGARFGSMVLSITRYGRFYFNDERVDVNGLPAALKTAAREYPDAPLIIEADKRVSLDAVVTAWNAAFSAGISEILIANRIAAVRKGML